MSVGRVICWWIRSSYQLVYVDMERFILNSGRIISLVCSMSSWKKEETTLDANLLQRERVLTRILKGVLERVVGGEILLPRFLNLYPPLTIWLLSFHLMDAINWWLTALSFGFNLPWSSSYTCSSLDSFLGERPSPRYSISSNVDSSSK